jgi:hypothetical protein
VWLNAIGNVYILQKQRDDDECDDESCDYIDRYNNKHEVRYFRSAKKLAHAFDRTNSQSGVIWDVDMDFFTEEEEVDDQPYTPLMSKRSIRGLLSPKHHWMQQILRNVEAITIALEPIYTGGMSRSLEIYRTWESVLFESPVFDERCQWRDDLFR